MLKDHLEEEDIYYVHAEGVGIILISISEINVLQSSVLTLSRLPWNTRASTYAPRSTGGESRVELKIVTFTRLIE